MSTYSKLIAALLGNVIAIVLVYLASKGLATCTIPSDSSTCSVFGFSTAQVVSAAQLLISSALVYFFPSNAAPPTA